MVRTFITLDRENRADSEACASSSGKGHSRGSRVMAANLHAQPQPQPQPLLLLHLLLLLLPPSLATSSPTASAFGAPHPHFTVHPDSRLKGHPTVEVLPIRLTSGAGAERNIFTYGAETHVKLSMKLTVPISPGATAEAWLSSLSLGTVARLAANKFVRYVITSLFPWQQNRVARARVLA